MIGLWRLANFLEALCMGLGPAGTVEAYMTFEGHDAKVAAAERIR